jgi:hypothetical protein
MDIEFNYQHNTELHEARLRGPLDNTSQMAVGKEN